MGISKLCKMVNAKNAMELDWGEMLREYIEIAWSKERADALSEGNYKQGGSEIGVVLYDGQISKAECTQFLGLRKDEWVEMGGDPDGKTPITKLAFIGAMRRFCERWSDCYNDFSKCENR